MQPVKLSGKLLDERECHNEIQHCWHRPPDAEVSRIGIQEGAWHFNRGGGGGSYRT